MAWENLIKMRPSRAGLLCLIVLGIIPCGGAYIYLFNPETFWKADIAKLVFLSLPITAVPLMAFAIILGLFFGTFNIKPPVQVESKISFESLFLSCVTFACFIEIVVFGLILSKKIFDQEYSVKESIIEIITVIVTMTIGIVTLLLARIGEHFFMKIKRRAKTNPKEINPTPKLP